MRILVISDKIFTRGLGDGLRVYGLLKPLVGRYRFDLICFARPQERLEPELRDLFDEVSFVPAPPAERSSLSQRLVNAFSARNFKPTSQAMQLAIAGRLATGRYDVVLDVAGNASPNLPVGPSRVPIVVDAIDEPLLREFRALKSSRWAERGGHLISAWRFWLYEKNVLYRAASIVYAADLDANMYTRFFPGRSVAVVPNGVDTDYFRPMAAPSEQPTVAFEGNMNFPPNIDTAKRLVNDVLPLILKKVSDVKVVLVGRDPSPEVTRLASDRVQVTGTVDDIRPYLARSTVFACPMRLGSGIKNKILQAWAMALPVVATSESLGGLSAQDGVNLLVRDSLEQFASGVAELILDPQRAATIGAAGRSTAERQYSWQHQAAQLEALLRTVVRGHSLADGLPVAE
jgi:glycosyltransferase involved in cell wall biosynthesis